MYVICEFLQVTDILRRLVHISASMDVKHQQLKIEITDFSESGCNKQTSTFCDNLELFKFK
jgi:hypothetical protein